MKDITEVFEEIINALVFKFNCKEVVVNGSNFILKTCNTYWLRPMKEITIATYKYKIVALDINKSITVSPISHTQTPVASTEMFDIVKPTYRHGTARAINTELTTIKQKDKTPFVWLYELFSERINTDAESVIGLSSPVRMFIFDEANPKDMLTENHYSDVIRPMKQLAKEIIKHINTNQSKYQEILNYEVINLAGWGEFNGFLGNEKKVLDEEWSGLEMKFDIEINKTCLNCN